MAATSGTVERRTVHLSGRAALTIVGTFMVLVLGQRVFVAAHRPLSWAAAATVAAILLDPLVDRLAARIRRVPAVLLTFLVIGAVALGTAYVAFDGLQDAVDRLETAAPDAAGRIEDRSDGLGEVARDFRLTERVTSFASTLSDRVTGGDDVLRSTAGTAPAYLVSAVFTVFLMTYGHRIGRAALDQDPDEARRARVAAVAGAAVARARAAILLTVGTALSVGVVAAALAGVLDLPAAVAVGFTAGLLAVLPHVGIVVGFVPMLLLTLGFRSALSAVVVGLVAIALQLVDSLVVRRWIAARSVDVGLFVPWVVALVGYEVYGVGGGAYALAFAVGGLAVLDQLHGRGALAAVEVVEDVVRGAPADERGAASGGAGTGSNRRRAPAERGGSTARRSGTGATKRAASAATRRPSSGTDRKARAGESAATGSTKAKTGTKATKAAKARTATKATKARTGTKATTPRKAPTARKAPRPRTAP